MSRHDNKFGETQGWWQPRLGWEKLQEEIR